MKIILFRNGNQGEVVSLPGEYPMVELSDLLGGEPDFIQLDKRLQLVTLTHGEKMKLPIRYSAQLRKTGKLGYEKIPVAGDCAVIARRADGVIVDARKDDCLMANLLVEAVQAPTIQSESAQGATEKDWLAKNEGASHDCEQAVQLFVEGASHDCEQEAATI